MEVLRATRGSTPLAAGTAVLMTTLVPFWSSTPEVYARRGEHGQHRLRSRGGLAYVLVFSGVPAKPVQSLANSGSTTVDVTDSDQACRGFAVMETLDGGRSGGVTFFL